MLPFGMTFRTRRYFDCGRHNEMLKGGIALFAFVFEDWHSLIYLKSVPNEFRPLDLHDRQGHRHDPLVRRLLRPGTVDTCADSTHVYR